jgi:transcription termination factor Rho
MKDMGEADVILNIKLIKGENEITLTQSHYVEKVLSLLAIRTANLLQHLMIPYLFFERTRELVETNYDILILFDHWCTWLVRLSLTSCLL